MKYKLPVTAINRRNRVDNTTESRIIDDGRCIQILELLADSFFLSHRNLERGKVLEQIFVEYAYPS